jgi:hypothetical protein
MNSDIHGAEIDIIVCPRHRTGGFHQSNLARLSRSHKNTQRGVGPVTGKAFVEIGPAIGACHAQDINRRTDRQRSGNPVQSVSLPDIEVVAPASKQITCAGRGLRNQIAVARFRANRPVAAGALHGHGRIAFRLPVA